AATETLSAAQEAGGAAGDVMAGGETAADTAGLPLILTIGLIVAAVAIIGVAIYELVTHWKTVFRDIKGAVLDAWRGIDRDFVQPVKKFFTEIIDFVKKHWELLLAVVT